MMSKDRSASRPGFVSIRGMTGLLRRKKQTILMVLRSANVVAINAVHVYWTRDSLHSLAHAMLLASRDG